MYVSTLLTFAIAAFSASTYAVGCFSGGELGYSSDGVAAANDACGALSGDLGVGQAKTSCINRGGIRWNMEVRNTSGSAIIVSRDQCISEMSATANGCPGSGRTRGGIRQTGALQTTIDPNSGTC